MGRRQFWEQRLYVNGLSQHRGRFHASTEAVIALARQQVYKCEKLNRKYVDNKGNTRCQLFTCQTIAGKRNEVVAYADDVAVIVKGKVPKYYYRYSEICTD